MENENLPQPATRKKISAAATGGAFSIILVWAVEQFSGVTIPAEVASAIGTICMLIASLLIPDEIEE